MQKVKWPEFDEKKYKVVAFSAWVWTALGNTVYVCAQKTGIVLNVNYLGERLKLYQTSTCAAFISRFFP